MAELHPERATGYAYETDLESRLEAGRERYDKAIALGRKGLKETEGLELSQENVSIRLKKLSVFVKEIVESQEPSGAWITCDDRFKKKMPEGVRWNGQYEKMDRISSSVFNENVTKLCEYIELSEMAIELPDRLKE
jgi:hypothetical protein